MAITLRINKGSELTFAELDENFTDLNTRINTLEGISNTDNQTLTLVGTDLTISGGNTVDLSGLSGSGVALTDLNVTVAAAGNANLTYDNATGVFTYTPPDLSSYATNVGLNTAIDGHLNTSTATANQVLSWDGADYAWVADQTGTAGIALTDLSVTTNTAGTAALSYDNSTGVFTYTPPNTAEIIEFTVHNDSGGVLTKGEVVYISGLNGNTPEVSKAQANSSTTMPAFGIVKDDIANTSDGTVITFGSCPTHNVADFGETGITFGLGNTLYVSATEAGKLTNVPPAGESNLIQNIGKIERATPTNNITIKVGGAGRTNATPNLDEGNIFIGNAQNQSSTVSFNSTVDGHLNTSTATANQVLSWDGSDYAWVADQTGSSYADSDVDTHLNTSTATANQVLSWDGADYVWVADQTGSGGANVTVQDDAPTNPAPSEGDLWWESDVGVLKIYYGSTWVDASPAGNSSSGIALTDLSVTVAAAGSANLAYDNITGAFTYTPPDLSSYLTSYTETDPVFLASAASGIAAGDITNWNTAYGWGDHSLAGYLTSYTETDTLDSVVGRGATTTTTAVIPFYYANQAAFPNATTYHGAIAHSHADGAMFFAHSGTWNQMANSTDLDFNNLSNQNDAYKVNIQSASLAQDHYPLMHSANTGTGITPLVDTEYRYNPDTNTLNVHNVTVLTELTAPAINPVTDTVGAIGTELVINGGDATALNSQGGDLTLDAGSGANLPGEINLGVNSSNTGQVNIGYSGSTVVVDGRTTFNGDVTLTTGTWETVNTSITTGAATVNVDCDSGHIVYLDASGGGFNSTFTINLVNLGNTANVASAVTVVIKQPTGAGVLPNAIQIGGIGQTLLWQGGSAPTPNAGGNAHDVFTFSVLDLGATNVVLGQMVDYA